MQFMIEITEEEARQFVSQYRGVWSTIDRIGSQIDEQLPPLFTVGDKVQWVGRADEGGVTIVVDIETDPWGSRYIVTYDGRRRLTWPDHQLRHAHGKGTDDRSTRRRDRPSAPADRGASLQGVADPVRTVML